MTATGTHEQIGTDTVLMDNFDLTKDRSAFYFLVKRQDDQDEFEAQDSIVEVLEEMLPKLGHNLSFTK